MQRTPAMGHSRRPIGAGAWVKQIPKASAGDAELAHAAWKNHGQLVRKMGSKVAAERRKRVELDRAIALTGCRHTGRSGDFSQRTLTDRFLCQSK